MWSKALSKALFLAIACFQTPAGACEKVSSDLGFLHHFQLASHAIKVTIIEIPIFVVVVVDNDDDVDDDDVDDDEEEEEEEDVDDGYVTAAG